MWLIAKVSLVSFVWLGASLQPDSSAQLAVSELQGGGIGDDGVESIFGFQNLPLTHCPPQLPRCRCPNGREGTACYKGQLTNRGAAQLRRNGASLRQALRSAGLAREPYTVEVHCTHIPRTMDSARALLEGLLGSRWAAGRVHVAQQHSGPALWLYPNREYCGALKARGGSVGAHLVGEEAADKAGFSKVGHWKLGEFFTNYTDQRVRLFDLYAARRCHQPGAGVYPCGEEGQCGFDELKSAATVAEVAQFLQAREEGWLQLVVGPLVDRLIVFLLGEGGSVPDFLYFSGHDTTLMPLLVALDLWERPPVGGEWPPYASTLLFSLWTTAEGADMVQLTYNGEPVELPACSYPCTTDKLRSALARLALKEEAWRGRCDAIEAKADAITQSVR